MIGARTRLGVRRRPGAAPSLARLFRGPQPRRRDRSGVDEPVSWRSRRWVRVLTALTAIVVAMFVAWLAWVAYLYFVRGGASGLALDPDRRCTELSFSCGILTNVLASGVLVAFASLFVLWRLFGLQRRYRAKARDESRELVPTAGAIIDQVVGRDELCKAVMADLRDRGTRPHVIVGGVGAGKTAVLVRLTELLAEKKAIPVPIRLRDATTELDFEELARDQFLTEVNPGLFSSSEGETIWRRLRKDGKIIVLADGLEEALIGTNAEPERDNIIRAAIRRAHQQRLPLVIASRPHDPLRATEAAILNLEPLSYEAALAYIGSDGVGEDERRLAWIVETADVVEAPLYLQITRELHLKGLLEPTSAGQQGVVDTRGVDRGKLRLSLLETWERALVSGHLREDIALNWAERQAAIEHMSALACVGLKCDLLEVDFDQDPGPLIKEELHRRLEKIDEETGQTPGVRNVNVRLAGAWAAQLDLVELRGDNVRFPHSLMQAYLGSRFLDAALLDESYAREVLQEPRPGREFLIALVLRSRIEERLGRRRSGSSRRNPPAVKRNPKGRGVVPENDLPELVEALRRATEDRNDNKVLDIYAGAFEIDSVAEVPEHETIAAEIKERWSRIHAQDPRTLEEGKLALVHRFGEAARMIDSRRRSEDELTVRPAYPHLYEIGCGERAYPVQMAVAQEIGAGGEAAYEELAHLLAAPCRKCQTERAKRPALERAGSAARAGAARASGAGPIGRVAEANSARASIISAWLAPMLVGSVGARSSSQTDRMIADHVRTDLAQWLRHVSQDGRLSKEDDLPIFVEIALAQGFKHAANRRPMQPDLLREARMLLAEQALEMLKNTRYWFTQLTLIHALCLLELSEGEKSGDTKGAKPEAIVQHWLDVAGRERTDRVLQPGAQAGPHPFVNEAALLCVLALKTRRPQRYLWIDESAVVAQVGSRNLGQDVHRRHRLWIPPSAGWTALNGRAQQLVADVLLLLNLADRGEQPDERERRLKRSNRQDLPPCITHYRTALEPGRTVGTAVSSTPGVSCVDGCVFELCPYPPKGVQPRVEMSEAFSRRQQTLLSRTFTQPLHPRAPWQEMPTAQLTKFWVEMADRARGARTRPATPRRTDRRA